ncbi:MAG: CocE/NonD family hydrolase, partial [Candidatus Rokuibacteriota bacterium]
MRIIQNARIRMRDGVRLAADLFMPDGAGPFPVILEYLPYRKDDNTVPRLEIHHYFAEHGFVGARVDIRGTGNSEGVATDEYPLEEQLDALVVIEWLASQPWSNGAVGMFGSSWGGFNALQVAMHAPPQLKAIVAMYATDDRYNDDIHYLRGCVHAEDQAHYGFSMVSMNALPPYPEIGDDWAEIWRERLERGESWLIKWLEEQVDGPYWQHGSLKADYGAIKCPTYLIGGWNDGYTNMC